MQVWKGMINQCLCIHKNMRAVISLIYEIYRLCRINQFAGISKMMPRPNGLKNVESNIYRLVVELFGNNKRFDVELGVA